MQGTRGGSGSRQKGAHSWAHLAGEAKLKQTECAEAGKTRRQEREVQGVDKVPDQQGGTGTE